MPLSGLQQIEWGISFPALGGQVYGGEYSYGKKRGQVSGQKSSLVNMFRDFHPQIETLLREALTGIYTSPLMTDQIPEVWKVLHIIIPNRAVR